MADEGALALAAAARVLPGQLKRALCTKDMQELEVAVSAAERTYRIFPEYMPASVRRMLPKAEELLARMKAQCEMRRGDHCFR